MTFTWEEARRELQQRRERALRLGGEDAVKRQHAAGRDTARERIQYLVDEGSFTEIGTLAVIEERNPDGSIREKRPAAHIGGLAKIDGRPVAVGADDYTVHGGAMTIYLDRPKGGLGGFVEDLAHEYRIPLVLLIESIGGDVAIQDMKGHAPLVSYISFERPVSLLAEVPVLVGVMGAAAGAAGGRAVASHFSVMTRDTGFICAAGPPVVRRALGLSIDKFELGGAQVHTTNGSIDNAAADEHDALNQIRKVLSYLPQNVWELPPYLPSDDPPDRLCPELYQIMPERRKRPFDPRRLINAIVDRGSFFEIGAGWGRSLVTGLATMAGHVTGVLCSNPIHLGGAVDADTGEKQSRFMDFCDLFNIPMAYFVDVPGIMIGPEAERTAAIRKGIRALQALYQVKVPIIAVYVRKAYGMAVNATSNPNRLGLRFAWPGTEFGDMPIEGSVEAGFRKQIAAAPDPDAMRREIEERLYREGSTWKTAEAFGVEEMIDPAETRFYLCRFIESCQGALRANLGLKPRYGLRL